MTSNPNLTLTLAFASIQQSTRLRLGFGLGFGLGTDLHIHPSVYKAVEFSLINGHVAAIHLSRVRVTVAEWVRGCGGG